jgi:hypothetical protein
MNPFPSVRIDIRYFTAPIVLARGPSLENGRNGTDHHFIAADAMSIAVWLRLAELSRRRDATSRTRPSY